ncbi:MAG TPA: thioredoxin family protein [Pirellulaceae bacterium]|jgi:thioredoxin-like negative regulator of GroEL|nr:thioredoxin family protein [Pirellulaceae bacterium]
MHGLALTTALQLCSLVATAQPYDQAYAEMEKSGRPLLVLVTAEWCPACHVMKDATLEKLAERGTLSKVEFAEVDLDQDPELAKKLMKGKSIPQLILFAKAPAGWKKTNLVGVQSELTVASLVDAAVASSAPVLAQATPAGGTESSGGVVPASATADE